MIYVKQSYNLHPASPANRDRFLASVDEYVLPANERLGARLVGAFFAHEECRSFFEQHLRFVAWIYNCAIVQLQCIQGSSHRNLKSWLGLRRAKSKSIDQGRP